MKNEDTVILPKGIAPIGKVKTVTETKAEGDKAREALNSAFRTHFEGKQGKIHVQKTQ